MLLVYTHENLGAYKSWIQEMNLEVKSNFPLKKKKIQVNSLHALEGIFHATKTSGVFKEGEEIMSSNLLVLKKDVSLM